MQYYFSLNTERMWEVECSRHGKETWDTMQKAVSAARWHYKKFPKCMNDPSRGADGNITMLCRLSDFRDGYPDTDRDGD